MSKTSVQQEWAGPVAFTVNYVSNHRMVVRYCRPLEKHDFDVYVPKMLLHEVMDTDPPCKLEVFIEKTPFPHQSIGFCGETYGCRIEADFWEYGYSEKKVHSIKYCSYLEGQMYGLYVPHEVFNGQEPPTRILMQVRPCAN